MRNIGFALVSAAALGLAACSSGEDQLNNVDINAADTSELNDLANAAANDAEAEALGNQLDQLNAESEAAPVDNLANPSEADTPVNGM